MKKVILLIIIAFIFSIGLRFTYINNIKDNSQFKYNNEYIINTNDGYYFAQGARDIMSGKYVNKKDKSVFDHSAVNENALPIVTVVVKKLTGLKLETIMFYLSGFLGSLVVIPIVLIGWLMGSLEIGFVAALLSSIAWSYYNRTMFGYYDTDMLNIVFPAFMLWSLIGALITKKSIYFLITGLEIVSYRWWYPQSYSIDTSFIFIVGLYILTILYVKKDYLINYKMKVRNKNKLKNNTNFYFILLTFMIFAVNDFPLSIRFILIIFLYVFYLKLNNFFIKHIWYIFGIGVFVFFLTGGLNPIIVQLKSYVFRNNLSMSDAQSLHLLFLNVFNTVSEAASIPLDRIAKRISGNNIVFIMSLIGYIMLLIRYRYFILGLPLIGLGLLSYIGGLRFTIYAIIPLSFGVAYLINYIASYVKDISKNNIAYYGTLVILTIATLYPNVSHLLTYNKYIKPVFVKNEIDTLNNIKKISSKKDYILSWWDYGYPIKFYSNLNTIVDGAMHSGDLNFPISYLLIQPQNNSAKMARLSVEYHEKQYILSKNLFDKNRTIIEYMILDNGYKSANKFLSDIEKVKLPQKTRDIYLYLPDRMMRIFPVVEQFSNLDIDSGKSYQRRLFMTFQNYKKVGNILYLPYKYNIDLSRGIFNYHGQRVSINKFIITGYNKQGKLLKVKKIYNKASSVNVIYMKSSGRFIILDDKMLNSTYIQLFVLENYDKSLYKPVIMTPLVKIYKLQI